MERIIKFVKQLEKNKIINKLKIDEVHKDEITFDKGLIKFWLFKEFSEENEYYIEVYKCEHINYSNREELSGAMIYNGSMINENVIGEESVINIIKEFIKENDYNDQRVKFLKGRIEKLTNDLSNEELNKKNPKISTSKRKKLEKFKNDLIVVTNFYK